MSTVIQATFGAFRDELDEHYDRRERLIKISRDITNASKKIIFSLHRLLTDGQISLWQREGTPNSSHGPITKATSKQFSAVRDLFASLQQDLAGGRYWRYTRPVYVLSSPWRPNEISS